MDRRNRGGSRRIDRDVNPVEIVRIVASLRGCVHRKSFSREIIWRCDVEERGDGRKVVGGATVVLHAVCFGSNLM